jgi:hypothetical protein
VLDANTVVHCRSYPLGAAKVSLGCMHRNVAKQELDRLQFSAGGPTKPGAASSEIMRSELLNADLSGELLHNVPYEFFRDGFAPDFACTILLRKSAPALISAALIQVVNRS